MNDVYITEYEETYMEMLNNIYEHGYEDGKNLRTGVETKRLPCQVIRVDLSKEFPILKSKKVYWKSAAEEILWIMQKQSNNIKDLKPHIWDEWADGNGSIGKAYGFQVAGQVVTKQGNEIKTYTDQVHYVLNTLKTDPTDRRCIITLWNREQLAEMKLNPCCHTSTWNLDGGKLNCILDQRSGDMPLGVPFNTTQYAILTHLFARHLGVEPGILLHVIADAHIYDRQRDGVAQQLYYYDTMRHNDVVAPAIPKLVFAVAAPTNFFDITIDDFVVTNYANMGVVNFGEVVK